MPPNPRFRAKIVPNVLKVKSFKGRPRPGHPERYEICEKDVADMMPKMVNRPMCYNHNTSDVVGKVLASYRNPKDNAWEIEFELDASTPKGRDTVDWVTKGRMRGVSLQHIHGINEPVEVSLCWKGMREGSETYEAIAASKISQLLHFDSNLGCYSRDSDPLEPIAIAASATEEPEDLFIFEFAMSNDLYVAASSSSAAEPATPAQPAPAAQPAQPAQPAAQPDAAAVSDADTNLLKRFSEIKKLLSQVGPAAPLKNAEKQEIVDVAALMEVEKEKETLRANALEQELRTYKEREAKVREETEAKLRKEQDEINASLKQKIGDFVAAFDDQPEAIAEARAAMDTMSTAGLAAWDKQNEKVKASYSGRGIQPSLQAQNAMSAFYKQRQMQMQQQQRTGLDSSMTIPVVRTAAAAAPLPIAASYTQQQHVFGRPHDRPYPTEAILASKQAHGASFAFGKYRPAQEYDAIEASNDLQTWQPGVGGNVNYSRVTNNPEIQRAMQAIFEATPPGNGCGGDSERVCIPSLWQDRSHLKIAVQAARSNKAQMPRGDYDPYRSHNLSGLEP